jgi:cytochrome b subunit of formate dehydrogenase
MDRRLVKYWIDIGLLVSGFLCISTGIIKLPGILGLFDVRQAILPVYQITLVHDFSGVVLTVLIIVHVILNWKWMVGVTHSLFREKK